MLPSILPASGVRKRIDPRHQLLRHGEAAKERKRPLPSTAALQAAVSVTIHPRASGHPAPRRSIQRVAHFSPATTIAGKFHSSGDQVPSAETAVIPDWPRRRSCARALMLRAARQAFRPARRLPLRLLQGLWADRQARQGATRGESARFASLQGRGHCVPDQRRGHLRLSEVKLQREVPIRASLEAAAQIHALGMQGEIICGHVGLGPSVHGAARLEPRLAHKQIRWRRAWPSSAPREPPARSPPLPFR